MRVAVITYFMSLVPVFVSSFPAIPSDNDYSSSSSDSSDSSSSADYSPFMPSEVFAQNDRNGDGMVTLKEYRRTNPDVTDAESKRTFDTFDQDKDGRISLDEFMSSIQHNPPTLEEEDCLTTMMRTCSGEFIDAVRRWGARQGDAMCHCLPIYRDCIERERALCSTETSEGDGAEKVLNSQVDTLLRRFKRSLCQDSDSPKATSPEDVFNTDVTLDYVLRGIRQVWSTHRGSKHRGSRRQSCIISTIRPCNRAFIAALQANEEDPCHSLVNYRHCVHKSTRRCRDPNIQHIQRSIKFLTKEHRRVKICSQYEQ